MEKYLKIYFWQAISIVLNFATVFVVTPFISSNQSLYGIFSVIMAAYFFISYADFGFLSAGMKYAAESYARKDLKSEVEVLGFSGMVFLTFIGLYALVMLGLSFAPTLLIKSLHAGHETSVARQLLLILALFCPVLVIQRVTQIIYGIRLQDYKFQRVLIVSNLVKMASTFFFFGNGRYMLVEYFLFSQLCSVLAVGYGLYNAGRYLHYDVRLLLKSFRFSRRLYEQTKKLAYTSIFLTICWILYYELDPFVIGKILGPKQVAVYAIALTPIIYMRTLFGTLFTPFIARFNHYIGLKDIDGLRALLHKVLILFLPLTIFPVVAVVLTVKNFILNWVGNAYTASIPVAVFLVLSYIFSFISYPAGLLLMAHERVKTMYFTSALQPIIYWTGIGATFALLGLQSFAYFKFLAFFLGSVVYLVLILRFMKISLLQFLMSVIVPAIFPLIVLCGSLLVVRDHLPLEHTKINLLIYFVTIGLAVTAAIICYYFTSATFRQHTNQLITNLYSKVRPDHVHKTEQL